MGEAFKTEHRLIDIRITFAFFAGIFSLVAYRKYPSLLSDFFLLAAFLLLFFLLFFPLLLVPLFEKWIKVSRFIAGVNTTILLMLLFVLIFIPTGVLKKVFGKDSMQRKPGSGESYWETYELAGLKEKSRYEKQF